MTWIYLILSSDPLSFLYLSLLVSSISTNSFEYSVHILTFKLLLKYRHVILWISKKYKAQVQVFLFTVEAWKYPEPDRFKMSPRFSVCRGSFPIRVPRHATETSLIAAFIFVSCSDRPFQSSSSSRSRIILRGLQASFVRNTGVIGVSKHYVKRPGYKASNAGRIYREISFLERYVPKGTGVPEEFLGLVRATNRSILWTKFGKSLVDSEQCRWKAEIEIGKGDGI